MEWKLNQVCVVVRDVDKTIEQYTSVFGIGPFRRYEVPLKRGEAQPTLKVAMARLGEVQLELIQAEPGENIYWEFFQKHGEGLHHLGFDVKDMEAELRWLKEKGVGVLRSGKGGKISFAYLDTAHLTGTILELLQRT